MSAVTADTVGGIDSGAILSRVARRWRGRGRRELAAYVTTGFRFRGANLRAVESRDTELVLTGPAGTGKSLTCLYKLHATAQANPGVRHLIVRKTRASLTTTGLVTFEEKVLGRSHPLVAGRGSRGSRKVYVYPNGSEIVVGGMDKESRVLSADYDIVYVQQAEELTESEWEVLGTRCRNGALSYQQLLADCNPDRPQHWIKKRASAGMLTLLESRHEDNPRLHDGHEWTSEGREYVFVRLARLTGVRAARFGRGVWAASEGMVYGDCWDAARNVIDRFPIPRSWRRIMAIDFGYKNAFVCGWWAIDPDGAMYLYRQMYMTERTVRAHAELINRINTGTSEEAWQVMDAGEKLRAVANAGRPRVADPRGDEDYHPGELIEACVCDHDAEDRATLREHGIATRPAHKAVKYGIQRVEDRMKVGTNGKPRLFMMRDSLVERDPALAAASLPCSTEEEVEGYVWPQGVDGKPQKEEPVKNDDHGMDMTRYAVCYVERGGTGMKVGLW